MTIKGRWPLRFDFVRNWRQPHLAMCILNQLHGLSTVCQFSYCLWELLLYSSSCSSHRMELSRNITWRYSRNICTKILEIVRTKLNKHTTGKSQVFNIYYSRWLPEQTNFTDAIRKLSLSKISTHLHTIHSWWRYSIKAKGDHYFWPNILTRVKIHCKLQVPIFTRWVLLAWWQWEVERSPISWRVSISGTEGDDKFRRIL